MPQKKGRSGAVSERSWKSNGFFLQFCPRRWYDGGIPHILRRNGRTILPKTENLQPEGKIQQYYQFFLKTVAIFVQSGIIKMHIHHYAIYLKEAKHGSKLTEFNQTLFRRR